MCLDHWIQPQIHTALHKAYPPSLTALFTLNVLESFQTIHLLVSTGAKPVVQEIYFSCVPPKKWARAGLAFADLIGGLCGVFRFPQNSFLFMPIFQTGCRMEYEIKRFTPNFFFQFSRKHTVFPDCPSCSFPCSESVVCPESVEL